jgi:hypothetical protein
MDAVYLHYTRNGKHGDKITTGSTVFYMKKVNNEKNIQKRYTYCKYMEHKNVQGKVAKEIFKPLIKSSTRTHWKDLLRYLGSKNVHSPK